MGKLLNKNMETIVTVSCTRDKWCLALQSNSLEKFVDEPCNHIVIVEDDKTSKTEWEEILFPIYKKHKLTLVTKDSHPQIYPTSNEIGGWHNQQIIKLSAYKIIDSDRYIVFDSKNMFIKPTKLSDFRYEGCGSKNNITDDWLQYWVPWLEFVSKKINRPVPKLVWSPLTPFVVKTKVARDIEQNCNFEQLAVDATKELVTVSEFLLYAFFSQPKHPDIGSYGGGYQHGNLSETLKHIESIKTFAIGRNNLQNLKERRFLESLFIYIGLEPSIVYNAMYKTTM